MSPDRGQLRRLSIKLLPRRRYGVTLTPVSYIYDAYYAALAAMPSGTNLWEDPNTSTRGLISSIYDSYATRTASYNLAGQAVGCNDGQGLSQAISYGGAGGSTVPKQITPNSNTGLGTTLSWNGFLGLTGSSSGSGASASYSYDSYARTSSSGSPDGAGTTYYYSSSPAFTLATINSSYMKTYYDGLGRPVKVETSDSGGTKSVTETESDSCACSPMRKIDRVSLPYAPGGTVY